MENQQLENRLTRLETSIDVIGNDLEEIKDTQKEIRDLALSVNTLAGSVKRLCEDVCGLALRMQTIEEKPGKRWEMIIGLIITLTVTGVGGFLLGKMLGG